jgi:hypothetical protein
MVGLTLFSPTIPAWMQDKSSRCGRKSDFSDASAGEHAMNKSRFMVQDEIPPMETASGRKVVQISTMVHAEREWAFIALCDDGSLWLYHGSWSRIENIPQTTFA